MGRMAETAMPQKVWHGHHARAAGASQRAGKTVEILRVRLGFSLVAS